MLTADQVPVGLRVETPVGVGTVVETGPQARALGMVAVKLDRVHHRHTVWLASKLWPVA